MKKYSFKLMTIIISCFMFLGTINAASGSITASSSSKQVVVGSTFTVSVKLSCSEALGSWQFGISYDSSNISLVSGDTNVADYGDGNAKSKTYSYTFRANKSGTASVRVVNATMAGWNEARIFTPSTSSSSVTIKTQAEIEASYSKDNNLKELGITGYELTPAFSKDVTEYKVVVPDTVTNISVTGKVNDSTAVARGFGDTPISEGVNKLEVVVTAQNGSIKTYVINVDVHDVNPIETEINSIKYTVVKKMELLTKPTGYEEAIIKINDVDVPAFKSELTHFTLVGLKDEKGSIQLYIYNKDDRSYEYYDEIKSLSATLYPLKLESGLDGFVKTLIKIGDKEYDGFQSEYDENFNVIYAMNTVNGNKGFYIYDKIENSVIPYSSKIYDVLKEENGEFKLYILILLSTSGLLLLLTILFWSKSHKMKRLVYKLASAKEKKEIPKESEIVEEEKRETKEEEVSQVSEEEVIEDEAELMDTELIDVSTINKHKKGLSRN